MSMLLMKMMMMVYEDYVSQIDHVQHPLSYDVNDLIVAMDVIVIERYVVQMLHSMMMMMMMDQFDVYDVDDDGDDDVPSMVAVDMEMVQMKDEDDDVIDVYDVNDYRQQLLMAVVVEQDDGNFDDDSS